MTRGDKKAATRTLCLNIARAAFSRQPYEAVTMRALAKAAGVSTGAFFGSFADKQALYREAMGREPGVSDCVEFLAKVAIDLAGTEYAGLGAEAEDLRKSLIGGHG